MDGFGFVQLSRIGAGKFGDVLSHSDSPTIQNIHLVGAKLQDPMGSGPSEGWHQPPKRDTASISVELVRHLMCWQPRKILKPKAQKPMPIPKTADS